MAYAKCIRSHGVPNFPDPVQTPSGHYGYRTSGIDPSSAAFQGALQACRTLPSPWNTTGQQLSSAEQQAWLTWAQCIRAHGVPDFPDPTFSGSEVHEPGVASSTPQLQSAMDACKSQQAVRRGPWRMTGSQRRGLCRSRRGLTLSGAGGRGATGRGISSVLAGAARARCRSRHRRPAPRLAREAGELGRTGAAVEHDEGAGARALGHGLAERDPDLSGGA